MSSKKTIIQTVNILIVVLVSIVNLFSFASTYLEDKTMVLWEDEIGEFCIYLQNIEDYDIKKSVEIISGKDYINNLEKISGEFLVKSNTKSSEFPLCLQVELPNKVVDGEKYLIEFGISDIAKNSGSGLVNIAPIQLKDKFYLTKNLAENPNQSFFTNKNILLLIILLIVITYMSKRKYRKNE